MVFKVQIIKIYLVMYKKHDENGGTMQQDSSLYWTNTRSLRQPM